MVFSLTAVSSRARIGRIMPWKVHFGFPSMVMAEELAGGLIRRRDIVMRPGSIQNYQTAAPTTFGS